MFNGLNSSNPDDNKENSFVLKSGNNSFEESVISMDTSFDCLMGQLAPNGQSGHIFDKRLKGISSSLGMIDEDSQESGIMTCGSELSKSSIDSLVNGKFVMSDQSNHSRYSNLSSMDDSDCGSSVVELYGSSIQYRLPSESHCGLRIIRSDVLGQLMSGNFNSIAQNFLIIDCRYPYEYQGGHLQNSKNLYRYTDLEQFLFQREGMHGVRPTFTPDTILIFHCEFSVNRAPTLARYLRRLDRQLNNNTYPRLHYPEVYLLKGGYKEAFSTIKIHCNPCSYQKMHDPNFLDQLQHYRSLTKSSSTSALTGRHNKPESSSNMKLSRSRSLKF